MQGDQSNQNVQQNSQVVIDKNTLVSIIQEAVKKEIDPLKSDVSQLKSDVSQLKSDVSQIKTDIQIQQAAITELQLWPTNKIAILQDVSGIIETETGRGSFLYYIDFQPMHSKMNT